MSHAVPENETERLNTLRGYQILDTHPEERFDDFTRLAASICRTPIALVSAGRPWLLGASRNLYREVLWCPYDLFNLPRVPGEELAAMKDTPTSGNKRAGA